MERQITHIQYENEEGQLFYFNDHNQSLQFFNANKSSSIPFKSI